MEIRLIKTEEAYREALGRLESLALQDPDQGTNEADQLDVLSLLVEEYEKRRYVFDTPDPISAIEFRMSEQGLRQRDLIPILGSRSRVSEVLGRKRQLTLPMIRALSEGLGIPTQLLVRPIEDLDGETAKFDWRKFPVKEMQKRGWLIARGDTNHKDIERLVRDFLERAGKSAESMPLYRRKLKGLGADSLDDSAACSTFAWIARILQRSLETRDMPAFSIDSLSMGFLHDLAKLSCVKNGAIAAIKALREIGIAVVVEPRLPRTLMDGAAMLNSKMQPVIGLTLRFDRVDYFWFTLLHEVAHVWKHLNMAGEAFVDRIDTEESGSRFEKEANRIARDALIPREAWARSAVRLQSSAESIKNFAEELGVHSAIVAGRVRFESGDFQKYTNLLGQGSIRKQFPDVSF